MGNTSVELAISNGGWGGDFILAPDGDLALAVDTQDDAPATEQRLARYVMTSPRIVDNYGNPIARADHLFYSDLGAGTRNYVGKNASPQDIHDLRSAILGQIATDPYIVQDPPPTVTITQDSSTGEALSVVVSAVTTVGAPITTDPIILRQGV